MTMKALQQRWKTADGRALAGEVLRFLHGMSSALPVDVGVHDGRHDLRGLALPAPPFGPTLTMGGSTATVMSGMHEFRAARWQDLDLSYAKLSNLRFFGSAITGCLFDKAVCADWRLWDSEVKDSSFAKAGLRDAALGTWQEGGTGNAWRNINFDGADLRGLLASGCLMEHCSFKSTKLKGAEFLQATIQYCEFTGVLQDVLFDGRAIPGHAEPGVLLDIDFTGATFRDVEFRGCHFQGVKLPDGIDLVPNFPRVARRVLELLGNDESVEARMLRAVSELALKLPGDDTSVGIFNRADYLSWGGEPLAALAESLIRQAR
ncbi:pentapeptide repeat-containing protein [Paenarthrobacter sp. NPDC057355]|uniref:pentapeptide repeat-containing protein n=1 Tax=Paenarthrobacter sp. NPDC057355 TaxID=3346105 RepID=UPI003633FFFF